MKGRRDSGQIKNVLVEPLIIVRKRFSLKNRFHHVLCGIFFGFRFDQLAIGSQFLLWLFPIFTLGKKSITAIVFLRAFPKTVHKIEVGTEGRKVSRAGRTDKRDPYEILWQNFFHPGSEAEFGIGTVKEHGEQDEGTQDLSLVFCWPPGVGIKLREIYPNRVKVEGHQFFTFLGVAIPKKHPHLGREPGL